MKSKILIAALFVAVTGTSSDAFSGEGHNHGDEGAAVANMNGPSRQPDGSVFLPKPAQRQIAVRTIVAKTDALPRTYALAGRVVMDPNSGGKVQALVEGRIEAGPGGLPVLGQSVKKGDVLAYVVPSADPIERSNQLAQLAELKAAMSLAAKRLARLRDLSDTVPRKEIEAAESELASLTARVKAVGGGLGSRDALVSPVSGAIALSNAVAGQVVDARELVFEIVDPRRMLVEAMAYDTDLASDISGASITAGNSRVPLEFIGAARRLREQALPLSFVATGEALERLAVGQPLEVYVETRSTVTGIRVPAASVLKNPANQAIVWVKTAPERFEPRTVTVAPLDGLTVAVTSGLAAGERVATGAATLINQIR